MKEAEEKLEQIRTTPRKARKKQTANVITGDEDVKE